MSVHACAGCGEVVCRTHVAVPTLPVNIGDATSAIGSTPPCAVRNAQFTPPARHDKTVLSVSCRVRRCKLSLETVWQSLNN